jgi:hypothetical protein
MQREWKSWPGMQVGGRHLHLTENLLQCLWMRVLLMGVLLLMLPEGTIHWRPASSALVALALQRACCAGKSENTLHKTAPLERSHFLACMSGLNRLQGLELEDRRLLTVMVVPYKHVAQPQAGHRWYQSTLPSLLIRPVLLMAVTKGCCTISVRQHKSYIQLHRCAGWPCRGVHIHHVPLASGCSWIEQLSASESA